MNRQYEFSETLSDRRAVIRSIAGASVIDAHNGGNSKEFGGPIFLGKFTYNTCTQPASVCESPAFLNNIDNVANYQQSFGNAELHRRRSVRWRSSRRTTTALAAASPSISAFATSGRPSPMQFSTSLPASALSMTSSGAVNTIFRGGYGIYHSQIVDNSVRQLCPRRTHGGLHLHRSTGQVGFPTSIAAAPLPAFPAWWRCTIRSLYVRPGQSAYLSQWFPTSALKGYPRRAAQSILTAMDSEHRTELRIHLDPLDGLRRHAHSAHHSSSGRRRSITIHPHLRHRIKLTTFTPSPARQRAHRAAGQLHASVLGLLLRAQRWHAATHTRTPAYASLWPSFRPTCTMAIFTTTRST